MNDLTVTFFPPLYEQRQGWILSVLRRERVLSLVDIGCGEGSLLSCLCNPSRFLCADSKSTESQTQNENDNLSPATTPPEFTQGEQLIHTIKKAIKDELKLELRTTSIAGLDIDLNTARYCADIIVPPPPPEGHQQQYYLRLPRWTPLDIKVFCGSLAEFNPTFVGVDCIVSTEVIEHLPPNVLPHFAPMLLGKYRPRLLLITTPSYTFNARFSAPGTPSPGGYPDPTLRTTRVFRHADHKFEWTPSEFENYCKAEAERYGYDVEIGGVGKPKEEDPWGREEELGWASQVATFRRRDVQNGGGDEANDQSASPRRKEEGKTTEGAEGEPHHADFPDEGKEVKGREGSKECRHELIAEYRYEAHETAGKPLARDEIQAKVLQVMDEYYSEEGWMVWSLWVEERISTACGGYFEKLLDAVLTCADLEVKTRSSSNNYNADNDDDNADSAAPVPATRWLVLFSDTKRHEDALAKMQAMNQGWLHPALNEDAQTDSDEESQANATEESIQHEQQLWEDTAGGDADDWQQRESWWASSEQGEWSRAAIGEEVDWGRVSESCWG